MVVTCDIPSVNCKNKALALHSFKRPFSGLYSGDGSYIRGETFSEVSLRLQKGHCMTKIIQGVPKKYSRLTRDQTIAFCFIV